MSIVTLTTDFGLADAYVGAMKGVILGIASGSDLVDLTHQIAPHNVREAAFALWASYRYFPSGTVHLVVVDPGVGGDRRAVALRTATAYFVGPDNGVFSYVKASETVAAVEILVRCYRLQHVSDTFHGRDVFAPAAAHLAAGVPLTQLGPPITDLQVLPPPQLAVRANRIVGEVLHADRFGNLITSIGQFEWAGKTARLTPVPWAAGGRPLEIEATRATIRIGDIELAGIRRSYAQAEVGDTLATIGGSGQLEIAIREGNAAKALGLRTGDSVDITIY
jgi:S-adenosylmethionine hydrolase